MKNKVLPLFVFIAAAISLSFTFVGDEPFQTAQPAAWKLAKNKNDIKVYTRKAQNSDIKEFKAVTIVRSEIQLLANLIEMVEAYPDWQANITTAEIFKGDEGERYVYYTTDVPWPIKDRDIVVSFQKKVSETGVITYTFDSKADYIDEQAGYLRIRDARGQWQFVPQDDNKIKVIYRFYGDPAGSIPNWIINMFIVDGPYETLCNLKELLELKND